MSFWLLGCYFDVFLDFAFDLGFCCLVDLVDCYLFCLGGYLILLFELFVGLAFGLLLVLLVDCLMCLPHTSSECYFVVFI